ncbi:hypothetical protein HDU79_001246 [Rhizoclosmatium sp. JEL0117]|nr:hypothetical protein HDU79_001246 [Rhizoclosmatium sp. JEL0117]
MSTETTTTETETVIGELKTTGDDSALKTDSEAVQVHYAAPSPLMKLLGDSLGLREPSDVKTLVAVGLCVAANFAIWTTNVSWPIKVLLWLALVQLTATVSTIVHNTIHVNIFHEPFNNRIFHIVLSICFGHPVCTFVSAHNLSHHRYTQMQQDFMRTTQMRYEHHLFNYLYFFSTVGHLIAASDMRYMRLMRRQKRRIWTDFALQLSAVIIMHVTCALINPLKWILFWNLPRMAASVFITNMNMLQHDGCARPVILEMGNPLNRTDGKGGLAPVHLMNINTSRNFTGWITNTLFFNNGFHGIHHIKPTLHWSKLPEAHAALVKPHIHPNLDQDNMALYFYRTFVLNNRVTYDGKPYNPDVDEISPEPENVDWFKYPEEHKWIAEEGPYWVIMDILDDARKLLF